MRSYLVLVPMILVLTVCTVAGQGPCDPDLVDRTTPDRGNHRDPSRYSLRGDRCEGLYGQDVAGSSLLTPISFTAHFDDFDRQTNHLILTWPAVGNGNLYVRAQSQRPKLYYRMDTVQAASHHRYEWPTDVLNRLELRRADLGVTAWMVERVGERERLVHVPLRIGAGRDPEISSKPRYALVMVPGADLEQVWTTLLAVNPQGPRFREVQARRDLRIGFYPAGRSFVVEFPIPQEPGLFRLDVDALLRGSARTASVSVLFRNPDHP